MTRAEVGVIIFLAVRLVFIRNTEFHHRREFGRCPAGRGNSAGGESALFVTRKMEYSCEIKLEVADAGTAAWLYSEESRTLSATHSTFL